LLQIFLCKTARRFLGTSVPHSATASKYSPRFVRHYVYRSIKFFKCIKYCICAPETM
jgi:hypothetical protein